MNTINIYMAKYKNFSIQAKASIWYSCCSILQKGISFIVIPIYTRMLTVAEYGQYTVFQSWRDIIIIFATLNLYCGIFTKAMVDYKDDRDAYTACMQGLGTIITGVFLIVYLVSSEFWNRLFDLDFTTMILLFAYYITYPAFSFWSVRQRVEYRYRCMVFVTLIVSIFTPIISIALLKLTDLRANAVIWGFLFVQIMVGLFFYISNFFRGKLFFHRKYWIHALAFNIPLIPHYLSLIILGQSDRIMIKAMCGSNKAGIYSLAYSVSQLMIIFISAINGSFVPWIYEKLKVQDYKSIAKVSNVLCILCGFMSLGAILISPEIIYILGTEEYMEAIWIVPVVSLSVYYTFCYGLFSNVEFYFDATKYVMLASTSGAILNIILNYIFIPIFGYIVAAYTTLICYLVFMIMHYLFMRIICKRKLQGIHIFDDKFIAISSVSLFILMIGCMLLYKITLLRYLVIIVMAVIGIVKIDKILNLIRGFKK